MRRIPRVLRLPHVLHQVQHVPQRTKRRGPIRIPTYSCLRFRSRREVRVQPGQGSPLRFAGIKNGEAVEPRRVGAAQPACLRGAKSPLQGVGAAQAAAEPTTPAKARPRCLIGS